MSDKFLEKFMIKSNTLIIFYIKSQTRYYLLKQISIDIIRNIF